MSGTERQPQPDAVVGRVPTPEPPPADAADAAAVESRAPEPAAVDVAAVDGAAVEPVENEPAEPAVATANQEAAETVETVEAAGAEPEPTGTTEQEPEPVEAEEPAPAVEPEPVEAEEPAPAEEPVAPEPVGSVAPVAPEPEAGSESAPAPADADLVPLPEIAPAIAAASMSRRVFLGFALSVAGGLAGAAAIGRLYPVFADTNGAPPPIVPTYDPSSKAWAFVVDTSACIGCGLCVVACKEENHVSEEPQFTRTWVERHTRTADGELYVDSPDAGIHGFPPQSVAPGAEGKPITDAWFEPRLCMQCENAPCTAVCPVGATYRTEDGVVLVDARRCIGCGYCVVACPYGARYITPAGDRNPNDMPGVADKCTWCYHRISQGRLPACVEVCPVGARKFGDASDPDGEIATIVRERNPRMLHPEYGTRPRVLYLGPSIEEA